MGATLFVAYLSTFVGQIANQVFFFILLRFLIVEEVGLYSWANAVATIFAYVLDLGLSVFLIGELSKCRYRLRAVIEMVLWLRAPVFLLGVVGVQLWHVITHSSMREYWILWIVGATYVIQLLETGVTCWLQVRQRQNVVNTVAMAIPVVRLIALAAVVLMKVDLGLIYVITVMVVTQIGGTACLFYLAWQEWRKEPTADREVEPGVLADRATLLRRFRLRGPRLALMYALNILQARLDWLLVAALVSKVALANYSLANKVVEMSMLVAGVWARTSFPWLSRPDAAEPLVRARLTLLRRLFVVGCGLFGVAAFFGAPWLIEIAFGGKYAGAEGSVKLMTLVTAVFMLNQYFLYVVLAGNQENRYTVLLLIATPIQVAIDAVLLPRVGIIGAAWGMLVMGLAVHGGQLALLLRAGVLEGREILRMEGFLGGLIAVVAGLWLVQLNIWAGLVIGVVACVALGGLVIERSDRALGLDWLKQYREKRRT